jgi:hypothetical protein
MKNWPTICLSILLYIFCTQEDTNTMIRYGIDSLADGSSGHSFRGRVSKSPHATKR